MTDLALAALLAGLTGGLHCIGMCGPFAAAGGVRWHVGRFFAYGVAGSAVGVGGAALPAGPWAAGVAAAFLVWSSLKFGGFIEAPVAGSLTGWLVAWSRRARALPPWLAPVALGALSALLPCGLFWSALGLAAASRSALGGAAVILVFGLGTLPALVAAGALLTRLAQRARRVVALGVLAAGLFALAHRAGFAPTVSLGLMGTASTHMETP